MIAKLQEVEDWLYEDGEDELSMEAIDNSCRGADLLPKPTEPTPKGAGVETKAPKKKKKK